jgi:hypothetical protein
MKPLPVGFMAIWIMPTLRCLGQGHSYTASGLDQFVEYQILHTNADWTADSPLSQIGPGYTNKIIKQNHLDMYLMFQLVALPSIPVPLQHVEWEWKGVGLNPTNGVWLLDTNSSYAHVLANDANTTSHPQWTNNIDNVTGRIKTSHLWAESTQPPDNSPKVESAFANKPL